MSLIPGPLSRPAADGCCLPRGKDGWTRVSPGWLQVAQECGSTGEELGATHGEKSCKVLRNGPGGDVPIHQAEDEQYWGREKEPVCVCLWV